MRVFNPRKGAQRGAIAALAVFGILGLIMLAGVASFNFGLLNRSNRELSLATDSAATSAASQLCSDLNCYDNARTVALEIMGKHSAISSMGGDRSLNVSNITVAPTEYVWESPENNIRITIERGLWNGQTFESYEGAWQAQHPGIPAFVAANAVRIKAARPRTKLLSSIMGGEFAVSASSIAVKGGTALSAVAPFAVPVCSLINNQGRYYGEQNSTELCKADRYFTQADRFETVSNSNPGEVTGPAFPWEPCNPEVQMSSYYYKWPTWPDGVLADFPLQRFADFGFFYFPSVATLNHFLNDFFAQSLTSPVDGDSCALVHGSFSIPWNQTSNYGDTTSLGTQARGFGGRPPYPQPNPHNGDLQREDQFGVIGLPNFPNGSIEGEIQAALVSSTNPLWSSRLGDDFRVLDTGFTALETEGRLWDAITNGIGGHPGVPDSTHPRLGDTPIGTFQREKVTVNFPVFPLNVPFGETEDCAALGFNLDGNACTYARYFSPTEAGLLQDGLQWVLGGADTGVKDGMCNSKWMTIQNFSITAGVGSWQDEAVLKANGVPVPGLSDDTPVWHVPIAVIADSSSNAKECYGVNGNAVRDPPLDPTRPHKIIGYVEGVIFDVDVGRPQPEVTVNFQGHNQTVRGWGFMEGNPGVTGCNTLHARLSCKRWFIPDSGLRTDPPTVLVQ